MSEATVPKSFGFRSTEEPEVVFVFDLARRMSAAFVHGKWVAEEGRCVIGDFAEGYTRIPEHEPQQLADQAWQDLHQ